MTQNFPTLYESASKLLQKIFSSYMNKKPKLPQNTHIPNKGVNPDG
jgi:hypothetical protein